MQYHLYGKILRNLELYNDAHEVGFEYILNPDTKELHHVVEPQNFWGSHKLKFADLENFIGLINVGILPIHYFEDGIGVPIYDLQTLDQIGTYRLNKCKHCFPSAD